MVDSYKQSLALINCKVSICFWNYLYFGCCVRNFHFFSCDIVCYLRTLLKRGIVLSELHAFISTFVLMAKKMLQYLF